MSDPILKELQKVSRRERESRRRRDELVVEATEQGHSRRRVADAAGFKSPNAVQRILRTAGIAALLTLALAASASASTLISPDSGTSYPYQRWVDRAKVPTPDVTLRVVEGGCNGATWDSCTEAGDYTIRMGTAPTFGAVRQVFLHELGHNFDYYAMTEPQRAGFMQATDQKGEWRQPSLGPLSPHELLAETYALCALGRVAWRPGSPAYEQAPVRHMLRACYLIRH